jgi:hypothetical protein
MNADAAQNPDASFGCGQCYAEDLDPAVAEDHERYELDTFLRDDSHFIVSLSHCVACGQRFISIFTEYIDWVRSEDDQYRTLMPLTDREAAELLAGTRPLFSVGELGGTRRYLESEWPSGMSKTVRWRSGGFEVREGY